MRPRRAACRFRARSLAPGERTQDPCRRLSGRGLATPMNTRWRRRLGAREGWTAPSGGNPSARLQVLLGASATVESLNITGQGAAPTSEEVTVSALGATILEVVFALLSAACFIYVLFKLGQEKGGGHALLGFLFPVWEGAKHGLWFMHMGLCLYDLLGCRAKFRNSLAAAGKEIRFNAVASPPKAVADMMPNRAAHSSHSGTVVTRTGPQRPRTVAWPLRHTTTTASAFITANAR